MSDHPFDRAVALERLSDDVSRGTSSDAYWNMIGPFGGVLAAALFRAAWDDPRRQGDPVALTVNFCAALAKGEYEIHARPVRTSRSTQHWTMELVQAGEVIATGSAMFGARPATFEHRPATPPDVPAFDTVPRFPGGISEWINRYDLRFIEGALGGKGEEPGPARSVLWIANDPPRPLDHVGLAALCDIFFGRIIHVRRRMVPFGTVSMTAYFHASGEDLARQGAAPVLGIADARIFERGFHDQSAELWSSDGKLLATSHQIVYYRDPA